MWPLRKTECVINILLYEINSIEMKMKNHLFQFLLLAICVSSLSSAQQSSNVANSNNDLVADNMLLWQRDNGGWPKDTYNIFFDDSKTDIDNDINKEKTKAVKVLVNYNKEQTPEQRKLALDTKYFTDATIDNNHTVKEIRYLLEAYKKTGNPGYLEGANKGIGYLLKAQYADGGWPQFYPDRKTYRHDITFNDNAMANVMNLMMDISKGISNMDVLNKKYVPLAKAAFDKGIDIILRTQLELNGKKTVWCAQYDEVSLKPAKARAYELPSLSGSESAEIVRVLMRVDHPSSAIKQSIADAIKWFEASKITGYKTERIRDSLQPRGQDVIVVPGANSVMWARFYDLETNKPFFCDRDGIKKNSLAEIGNERRTGYAWYGTWPLKLILEEYPAWEKAHP
jgi:PelA/Pel-15E family pectate lyase